jgi:hypothetical protein
MARKKTQGRKPDASVRFRAGQALALALEGHPWQTIADRVGYSGKGAAFNAVQRELQRTVAPVAEEYRTLELMRLDALLTVFWPKAMAGDGWSMDRVLRIMERRTAFLGLDKPPTQEAPIAARVVVRAYPPEWIAALPGAPPTAPTAAALPPAEERATAEEGQAPS